MPKKRNRDQDGLYKRKDSPYWWVSYINAGGARARRSTGTVDRKEAEAILAKWRLDAHRQAVWDEQPCRTFDELMLAYLKATENEKRAADRDRVSMRHLYPTFTGCDLSRLSSVDVRKYISKRKQEGAAAGTINREVGLLSSAMNYANREWGWCIQNTAAMCKQREPEGRVRWLTKAEAAALLKAADLDSRSRHLADFIRLALNTGCRKGELLGLEWRRVDLKAELIYLEAHHTKSGKRISVPLNGEARQAILSRARFRAAHCPASPWVFAHDSGKRIGDTKRSFATACRKAGIEDFRIHDLRHTCAAWLVSLGVPLTEVRDLLGHSSIKMTERYAHLAPENVRAAVNLLDGRESRLSHVEEIEKLQVLGKSLK
jgi:integrase